MNYNLKNRNLNHILKTHTQHFDEVLCGLKDFEIRLNDRKFKVGDICRLIEIVGTKQHRTCPNIENCLHLAHNNQIQNITCNEKREICSEYKEEIYSGRKITIKITAIFDISDITNDHKFDNYVAFKFKVLETENC